MDKIPKLRILEVNNTDLPGRRFNGYDLQKEINSSKYHSAKQIVIDKFSKDKNVIKFFAQNRDMTFYYVFSNLENDILSTHSQISLTSPALIGNRYFKDADVVHYHLIHNTKLSLYSLIELCRKKASVISIHDPWIFTGRCVHPQDCNKWLTGCAKCEYLNTLFQLKKDNSKYLWKLKKEVYKNLDVDIIVSTPFMLDMLKKSPLTNHFQNVHLIPFGIDLKKFSNSISKETARERLGIPKEDIVLFFRSQDEFKGTKYIHEAMEQMECEKSITLLSCDNIGLFDDLKSKYNVIDLGHIEDDQMVLAYNACDIFLMPSIGESFGLMAIEAMACSKPVVIFNNTALPSITYAPECGILVENKNSTKLMEAIKWMIDDEDERIRRGNLGRKIAEEQYDVKVYNEKMNKLYAQAYERQKDKIVSHITNYKIDYTDNSVQKLIKKLKIIINRTTIFNKSRFSFYKYEIKNCGYNNDEIDYSLIDVQELLKQFNQELYQHFIVDAKKNTYIEYKIKSLFYLMLKDRKSFNSRVKNKIKRIFSKV